MFDNRIYRDQHAKKGLVSFDITVKETNLNIQAGSNMSQDAVRAVLACRNIIENYISLNPEFATSLVPLTASGAVPGIIDDMLTAGQKAGTGPMASVAGTVAEYTGRALLKSTPEVVVENGGDIFVKSDSDTLFGIYAQDSPFFMTTAIQVARQSEPYGVCTSSGTLGHSKSFGKADAATVMADSCSLADAVATALGNRVAEAGDINRAIEWGRSIPGIRGVVIIKEKHIGLWGDFKLVPLTQPKE